MPPHREPDRPRRFVSGSPVAGTVALIGLILLAGKAVSAEDAEDSLSLWHYQLYVDAGYDTSDTNPENQVWRSKSTTSALDSFELFLGMGKVRKETTPDSRWGLEFGLQTGRDTEGLVTSPPPPALEPVDNADAWRHLYRANVSYLFDAGRGLRLTGGLINSYIGYESYLAIDNPNYTRGYLLDTVPYFMIGLEADWDVSETVDLGFYLTTGYNYLTRPNDVPSPGLKVTWKVSPGTTVIQNLYYGPDQAETGLEFWRVLSDTIVEWKHGSWLVAAALDFGTEKQAHLVGQPRNSWSSGAVWVRWQFANGWSAALRPEFYSDPEGQITGAKQFIQAYTGTIKYQLSPRHHRIVGVLEARYDRSTGDAGGFYEGPDNLLVPSQSLVLLGLLWSFEP